MEEDLDHILWQCEYTSSIWDVFPNVWLLCGLSEGYQKYDRGVPPQSTAGEEWSFFIVCWGMCYFYGLYGEQNNRTFRGRDRGPSEI